MSDENKKDEPKVQADNNSIAIGNISAGRNIGDIKITTGYTVEQVSVLITQIQSTFQTKPFDGRCPYKGLDVFEEEDAELFFGREKLVDDLVSRIQNSRTVFVTGPSGSGKSSLVRAGLIHTLKQGAIKGSERWLYATMKPGRDPLSELGRVASSLADSTNAENEIRAKAMVDATIFARWCEIALKEGRDKRIVLFIDQFEEVFTQMNNEAERVAFLNLLTHAATIQNGRVVILFSMRSDFVSNCATYPQINALLGQKYAFAPVGAMQPEELVSAIAQPALRVGLRIDPDLIAQIINEMKGEPGALPLMQFALKDLFDSQQEKSGVIALAFNDYLQRGGIHKALERHADDSFSKLSKNEQELARSIFSRLIEIGRGTQDTKRTALFDELVPASAKAADVEAIVQKLADARLITTDEQAGRDTVTISHEKLIDAWPWLKKLVNENRDVFALQNEITSDAKEWEGHKCEASYLYSGGRLTNVCEQLDTGKLNLSDTARKFIEVGKARQKRNRTNAISGISTIIAILVLAVVVFSRQSTINAQTASTAQAASTYAVSQQGTAQANAEEAQKQAKISRLGELAAQSVSLRNKNFLISLLLGVEALKGTNERLTSVQAQSALLENSQTNPRLEQFLNGNTGPVVSAVFSPDGKTLASGTYDKDILLWDVKTRQLIGKLSGHLDIVRSIAFSRNGSMMVSGSEDKTIILWDMKTRHPIGNPFRGHSDVITSVAFSPDGKTLASGSNDTTIILWDVRTGQPIHTLSGHSKIIRSVAFSPDGSTLASGSDDDTIILWDVKTGQPINTLSGHTGPILSIAFNSDGKTLVSGSYDKNVILWDVKTGQPFKTLSGHLKSVRSVIFSPDGSMLASGSEDKTIILWRLKTDRIRDELRGHSDLINSLSFSPDGSTLASGSGDKTIILWDVNPRQLISRHLNGYTHAGPVLSIAFSPDGKTLASGSSDTNIMLWNVEKARSISQPLSGHTAPITSIAFSPDGRMLASGSYDTTIILWDVEKCKSIDGPMIGYLAPITSIAFSPDGRILASGNEDKTVILWDVEKHQSIGQPLRGHTAPITSIAFSPDGKTLASGSDDKTVILWDVKKYQSISQPLSGHSAPITSLAFSPDGGTLASGSYDRTIILWDVEKRQPIVPLVGHSGFINSLSFSPDGKTLASGSLDQTVILWDVKTHQPIGSLSGHSAPVQSVAFSPDGKTLASSSFDVILWDINEKSWINESCQRAGRNFTRKEWELYFPIDEYRKTCLEFPLEPAATPTATP